MALQWSEVESMVERFTGRLRERVSVDEVWVYGSYVNGAPREESDIDVAIISPDMGRSRWKDSKLLGDALLPDALAIQPVAFRPELKQNPRGTLLEEILRTGRRVA